MTNELNSNIDRRELSTRDSGVLDGKRILVTGGAAGLGRTIVEMLVQEGARVAFTYRSSADAANELENRFGDCVAGWCADATDFSVAHAVVDEVVAKFGGVDVLVNNAASAKHASFIQLTADDVRYSIENTFMSAFNYANAVAPYMIEQQSGVILSIGSINGERGRQGSAPYCAAKAAIEGLSKTIAKELGEYGVACNVIAPGFIATQKQERTSPIIKKTVLDECAIRRLTDPREVANLVVFLASDKARNITGQIYRIDCGQYI